eukprot:XP_001709805.1 Hypothetical protein GL50803_37047 [Giardia lamblia ATCC 50803]
MELKHSSQKKSVHICSSQKPQIFRFKIVRLISDWDDMNTC